MSASWVNLPMSEKLHAVYKGDWHDSIVSKAMRIASSPVPFLSEWDEGLGYGSFPEGLVHDEGSGLPGDPQGVYTDLPTDIANILFGSRPS
jgi:hypothetical protein